MTQTELLHNYLRTSTHGASLRELISNAIDTWPSTPKTIAHSVCRLLHDHCAECKGYKGKENLFAYRVVGKRKIWFAREP